MSTRDRWSPGGTRLDSPVGYSFSCFCVHWLIPCLTMGPGQKPFWAPFSPQAQPNLLTGQSGLLAPDPWPQAAHRAWGPERWGLQGESGGWSFVAWRTGDKKGRGGAWGGGPLSQGLWGEDPTLNSR